MEINIDVHELMLKLQELLDDGYLVAELSINESDEENENKRKYLSVFALECGGCESVDYEIIDEVSQEVIDNIP